MSKNVSVTFLVDGEPTSQVILARGTSFETLREKWEEVSRDSRPIAFLQEALDGPALPEEGFLQDVVLSQRGVLALHVLHAEERKVQVTGTQLEPVAIQLRPRESAEELLRRLKRLFGIEEGRVARLLCNGRPVDNEVPPCHLSGSAGLEVDLQVRLRACYIEPASFQPVLRDALDRHVVNKDLEAAGVSGGSDPSRPHALPAFAQSADVREVLLFASEAARALTGPGDCRATAFGSGVIVAGDEAVARLVPEEALLSGAPSGVVVERRMRLRVEDKLRRRSSEAFVWPTAKLGDLLANPDDSLILSGEQADSGVSFWEAGLQDGSCVSITRFLTLSVFDESGKVMKTTADLGESLLDLRLRLGFPEADFEMWSDGDLLPGGERSLAELRIDSTSLLAARPRSRAVALRLLKEDPVSMGLVKKSTTFQAFLTAAAAALKTKLSPKTQFVCRCGRVFSAETKERKDFPMSCCTSSTLHFAVRQPPQNRADQTAVRGRGVSCETVVSKVEGETQTDRGLGRAEVQTGGRPANRTASTERAGQSAERARRSPERASERAISLRLRPPLPQPLHIETRFAGGDQKETVVVLDRGSPCLAVLAAAEQRLQITLDSALLFSEERVFDRGGEERRAIRCFDPMRERRAFYVDCEDGAEMERRPLYDILHIFRLSAPIPASPRLAPRIVAEPSADVLCVTESRDLGAAPHGALSDPAFVALLCGVRRGAQLFWEGRVGNFIDTASDKLYSRQNIPGGPQRFVLALMRAGSPVPRCNTSGYLLRVRRRSGLHLEVWGGSLQSTGRRLPLDNERWDEPLSSDAFVKSFTEAANK